MPLLSEITFGALAVYSPRGREARSLLSQRICAAVKQDSFVSLGGVDVRIIPRLVSRLGEKIRGSELEDLFADKPVLVPAPRSSPMRPDSLFPTKVICDELASAGFGSEVRTLLRRTYAVRKAATAPSGERPTARNHYDSLAAERELVASRSILVVDDVITSGSMLIASVSRLREVYPRARIQAFGLIRTMSNSEIRNIYELCAGMVTLRDGRSTRSP